MDSEIEPDYSDTDSMAGATGAPEVFDNGMEEIARHSAAHALKVQQYHHILMADAERSAVPLQRRLTAMAGRTSVWAASAQEAQRRRTMRRSIEQEHVGAVLVDHPNVELDHEAQQLLSFHRVVEEETHRVPIPENAPLVNCTCSYPAELVEMNDGEVGQPRDQIYVCKHGECMFWQPFFGVGTEGTVALGVDQPGGAHDLDYHDPELESESAGDDAGLQTLQHMPIVEFWKTMKTEMKVLTEEQTEMLMGPKIFRDSPSCNCEGEKSKDVALVEDPGGDLFWVCGHEKCFFVLLAKPKPKADPSTLFDTGQQAKIGEVIFDRYTSVPHILKWFGRSFSFKTYQKLSAPGAYGEMEFPKESYQIQPDEEYDVFLSYRGGTGRLLLWITWLTRMNVTPTLIALLVVFPLVALFLWSWFPEPVYYVSKFWLGAMTRDLEAVKRDTLFTSIFPQDRSWFVFIPYGSIVLLIMLLFWNPIGTMWNKKPKKIWFDKFCVHQSNMELNAAGLCRMPLYLAKTKVLCCIFDSQYMSRLWCIFELATYLKLRKNPVPVFINTSQKLVEIILITWNILSFVMVCVVTRMTRSINSGNMDKQLQSPFYLWFRFFDSISISTVVFLVAQRWFRDAITLREAVANYDVREAQLSNPADRALLLQFINYHWGGRPDGKPQEDPAGTGGSGAPVTGLDAFNRNIRERVHRCLPVAGPRSWILAGYAGSVIAGARAALVDYEYFSYHAIWNDEAWLSKDPTCIWCPLDPGTQVQLDPTCVSTQDYPCFNPDKDTYNYDIQSIYFADLRQGITSIFSLAMRLFIVKPMLWFVLGCEIRFFLWLQQKSRLPYWWSVAITLPIFLFLECVMDWRTNLFFCLSNVISLSTGSRNVNVSIYSFSYSPAKEASTQTAVVGAGVAIEETSGLFSGIKAWNPDAAWAVMWWPMTFRPFWGIFYLVQHYSGGCNWEWAKRPEWSARGVCSATQYTDKVSCEGAGQKWTSDIYSYECATTDMSEEWLAGDHTGCDECEKYQFSNMLADPDGAPPEYAPKSHWNHSYYLSIPWTVGMAFLVWAVFIIPMMALMYYVHESPQLRALRLSLWSKITGIRTRKAKLNLGDPDDSDNEEEVVEMLNDEQAILKELSAISSSSSKSSKSRLSDIMDRIKDHVSSQKSVKGASSSLNDHARG